MKQELKSPPGRRKRGIRDQRIWDMQSHYAESQVSGQLTRCCISKLFAAGELSREVVWIVSSHTQSTDLQRAEMRDTRSGQGEQEGSKACPR
eukprot:6187230-Pleurochrysis_carterae.AAC.3